MLQLNINNIESEVLSVCGEEFQQLLLEERNLYYKKGSFFLKHNETFGLSRVEVENCKAYAKYVNEIQVQSRTIADIYQLEPKKIIEISKLINKNRYQELETYLKKNKVKLCVVKQIIEILNENDEISIDEAHNRANAENKKMRIEAKVKREEKARIVYENNTLKIKLSDFEKKLKELSEENKKLKEKLEHIATNQISAIPESIQIQQESSMPLVLQSSPPAVYLSHS